MQKVLGFIIIIITSVTLSAQPGIGSQWTPDGNGYYRISSDEINLIDLQTQVETTIISKSQLTPEGSDTPLRIKDFSFSDDQKKVLIFTNAQRVWRYETRGDYWVLDITNDKLSKLGNSLPEATLMFAKFSPDGMKVAYVSNHNIYLEDLNGSNIIPLTSSNGTPKLINGTFDWAYEEEFSCLDGFRWSPDGKSIAYWQIDANTIRDFYMVNITDSIYSFVVPVEYPKVGESPSACRIGVINIGTKKTKWMKVPGDERQNYIPRMEWAANSDQLILQQLNRKQNVSKLMYANINSGEVSTFYEESDKAWISVRSKWSNNNGWNWIEGGKYFIWVTEEDGWRHLYKISRNGKNKKLVTSGEYDIINPVLVDEKTNSIYFTASPDNATERYLYRTSIDGSGLLEKITPSDQEGTHSYQVSPNGKYAYHSFSNYYTFPMREWVNLPDHKALNSDESIATKFNPSAKKSSNVEFFKVVTDDGIEMDGWIAKPNNFDPTMKYPVLFNVYTEPAGQTVINRFGTGRNMLYNGDMAEDGYIYMSVEGRGAPAPKGKEWRKSIYRKIGIINIRDQAMACQKIIETFPFVDSERIAVHGWSGGGSATLNLLFQYPDLYQTGIAVAAVTNQLTYDNIYQERYMGIPQENKEDFIKGSPLTYAKNLKGNLLYIHGTGDDNVHYQNAELLINELVKHNKQFQFMPYPNRAHGIRRGEGTRKHLSTLFTNYLKEHCPPGPKPQ